MRLHLIFLFCFASIFSCSNTDYQIVEASCGQCQFGLKGQGCDLAVRINGIAYFVDGSDIDEHGDAHDEMGFCNAIRQAKISGQIKEGRFIASHFEVVE